MSSAARSIVVPTVDAPPPRRALVRLPYPTTSQADPFAFDGCLLALLVTDLEGFTSMVERLGDLDARALMQEHNRIVRDALLAHGGREIAHTGDGIMAAFRSVASALQAATEIQCELEEHTRARPDMPLRARIGVHAGEPLPEDGRLFGTCVNTAVRVCAASGAARVLVSDLVCQLAAGRAFRFEPAGPVALKGLARPMQVHELLWRTERRAVTDQRPVLCAEDSA